MGASGRKALSNKLPDLVKKNKIDFVIVNGENASDDGRGITKEITDEFFKIGVDVITSGNHIWDKKETTDFIENENRLLRPANLADGSPGRGYKIYFSKDQKFKVGVVNLMGNVFMRKTEDVFKSAKEISNKFKLKKNVDFLVVDFHGEITSEKMAIGHFFDGSTTGVVGTHTHVPTADTRILEPALLSTHIVPDIMLVPLLAYDNQNNRLGYGGGFYDRYLKKYLKTNKNILTIGIAFSFQKHHKIPVSKNDVKLNYILTEKGIV